MSKHDELTDLGVKFINEACATGASPIEIAQLFEDLAVVTERRKDLPLNEFGLKLLGPEYTGKAKE